jgi:hypothetical protein
VITAARHTSALGADSGFDTHAQQGAGGGAYGNLMDAPGDGL